MAKKSKKKTIASTRKPPVTEAERPKKKEKRKGLSLKKIISTKIKKAKPEAKALPKPLPKLAEKTAEEKRLEKEEKESIREAAKLIQASKDAQIESSNAEKKALLKKEKSLARKKRRPLSPGGKRKIISGFLLIVAIVALGFFGWLIYKKIFHAAYLADYLPLNNSVAVLEVNIDGNSDNIKKFENLMAKYPLYSSNGIISLVNYVFPVDFQSELTPWLGRKVGLGLVALGKDNKLSPVLFAEASDQDKAIKFLNNQAVKLSDNVLQIDDYSGYKIYTFKLYQNFAVTFVGKYLVATESKDSLLSFLDSLADNNRLSNNADFQKIANNLPQAAIVFGYVDTQKLFQFLSVDQQYMAAHGQDLAALRPLVDAFKATGLIINPSDNSLVLQTYTLTDQTKYKTGLIKFDQKYQGKMLSLADDAAFLVAGGIDLSKEIQSYQNVFSSSTKSSDLIFQGWLGALKNRYLGSDVNLQNDLYPLLQNEYLLQVSGSLDKPKILAAIEMGDPTTDLSRFGKIITAFENKGGFYTPTIHNVTLPDGTPGQEIVGNSQQIVPTSTQYGSVTVSTLKIGSSGISVNYATYGSYIIFSNDLVTLENAIDNASGTSQSTFNKTAFYLNTITPLMRNADQLLNIKLGAIIGLMGLNDNPITKGYLLPFGNLAITKNYFDDGISTIYQLEII